MHNKHWFLIIFAIYLLGFFSHALYLKKTVYGDGIFYYSWLRSAVIDHDIDFRDEYRFFAAGRPYTVSGLPGNKYSPGPAFFWSPAYIFTNLLVRGTGYELPYQLAVGLMGVFYTITGLVLLYRLLIAFFREQIAMLAILSLSLATNLFYYGSLDTVNSHGLSFFAVCVFLSLLLSNKKNWFLIGLSLGLIGLVRPQDLLIGLAVLPFLSLRRLPALFLGTVSGFLPQLPAWQTLYGKFWVSPYLLAGEYFDFFHPHILEVLFAPWYGLFFFSPILLPGLGGLFFLKNQLKFAVLTILFLALLVIASWSVWWQGAAVGSRMMISSFPLFGLGLGYFFEKLLKKLNLNLIILTLVAPLSALNFLLTFSYLILH